MGGERDSSAELASKTGLARPDHPLPKVSGVPDLVDVYRQSLPGSDFPLTSA